MSELIERVAKAIYEVCPIEDAGEAIDGFQVTPGGPIKWATIVECYGDIATGHRDEARAAIAAMREPNQKMRIAGKRAMPVEYEFRTMQSGDGAEYPFAVYQVVVGFAAPKAQIAPESVWNAMIDTALAAAVPAQAGMTALTVAKPTTGA